MKPSDLIPARPVFDPRRRRERAEELWRRYPINTVEAFNAYLMSIIEPVVRTRIFKPKEQIVMALFECMQETAIDNFIFISEPPYQWADDVSINLEDEISPLRPNAFKELFTKHLESLFNSFDYQAIPEHGVGTVPLVTTMSSLAPLHLVFLNELTAYLPDKRTMHAVPVNLNRYIENRKIASGFRPSATLTHKDEEKLKYPSDLKLSGTEAADLWLRGTHWQSFFKTPVPFEIPVHRRLEHTAIVAGSGAGKTQLLQSMILSDLKRDDPPSMIVLDSTGAMIEKIQKLAVFNERLRDRILIIDPAHAPSLNMFDVFTDRHRAYTADQREDLQTEIVALFNYVFASGDYDLTAQMGTAFSYAVRLILTLPGATITDLRRLLEENPKGGYAQSVFRPLIERMDADTIDFFSNHFFAQGLVGTRLSIARRLHKVIGVPAFRRMFTAGTNALDLFTDMQRGTIILVNTNQQLLKEDSYVLFGRYMIARVLAAAFERATIPPEQRRETYLVVDESAPYFDATFESLLTRVRQFKLGVVIAFQHLEQASAKLQSAISSSTSVKFAARLGFTDRRWLGREMETTPEFIQAQTQGPSGDRPQWSQFATFVRGTTPTAISLTIPLGALEREPQMTKAQHDDLLRRNLARVTPNLAPLAPVAPMVEPVPDPSPERDSAPLPLEPKKAAAPHPKPRLPLTHTPETDELPTEWGGDKIK